MVHFESIIADVPRKLVSEELRAKIRRKIHRQMRDMTWPVKKIQNKFHTFFLEMEMLKFKLPVRPPPRNPRSAAPACPTSS